MILEILKFILSDFFVWAGFCIAVGAALRTAEFFWNRFLRMLNIRKHGWPPSHLDADGDWKPGKDS